MTEDTVNKFAALFAKCATTGDTAELRKEAAASALVKNAISSEQVLVPAAIATGGGLAGYLGTKDEKKKLRNALTGALLGGGGSAALQFGYSQLAPSEPGAAPRDIWADLTRLAGGGAGGRAGYRVGKWLAPTDKNIGELARAAKPVNSGFTSGRSWGDWWHGRPGPKDNKTLQQMFSDLAASRRMPGVTTNDEAVKRFVSTLGGGKKVDPGTIRILTDMLDNGRLSSDPTARAKAMDVISSLTTRGPKGGGKVTPVSPQAVSEFFNARQRGIGRFGKPVAGSLIGGTIGTTLADLLIDGAQGLMGGSNEAK